jgi:hypothetical protein
MRIAEAACERGVRLLRPTGVLSISTPGPTNAPGNGCGGVRLGQHLCQTWQRKRARAEDRGSSSPSGLSRSFLRRYMRFSARVADYEIFATAVHLVSEGRHRTREGIVELVALAYTINGHGKHRRVPQSEVLDRILRGHTLNAVSHGEDMVRPPRRRGELGETETT